MEPSVRPARADEVGMLSRIHQVSWQSAYRGLLDEADLSDIKEDHWTAYFQQGFDEQTRTVWVSLADEHPVACASVDAGAATVHRPKTDALELISMYCMPAFWGRGYGAALMQTVQRYAAAQGYAQIKLWVMSENLRARSFYEQFGFVKTDETVQYAVGRTEVEAIQYVWAVKQIDHILTDNGIRQWANRFLRAVVEQKDELLTAFFHPEAVISWPNTNERFTRAGYVTANCRYPGRWRGTLERVEPIAGGLVLAARIESLDGGSPHHVVSFFELESGRVRRLDEYWGADGAPPDWRQNLGLAEPIESERSSDNG